VASETDCCCWRSCRLIEDLVPHELQASISTHLMCCTGRSSYRREPEGFSRDCFARRLEYALNVLRAQRRRACEQIANRLAIDRLTCDWTNRGQRKTKCEGHEAQSHAS